MKQNPLVSIVVPTFNRKDFTERCLQNILSQSYQNLELIIVDGASTDGTVEMLKHWSQKDSRLKFISEKDKGECDAINKGYKMVSGDIVAYIPCDDYYTEDSIAISVKFLLDHPDVDVVGGDIRYVDPEGNDLGYGMTAYRGNLNPKTVKRYLYTHTHTPVFSQGFCFRRECLECGLVDPEFSLTHDLEFQIRLAAAGKRFAAIDRVQAKYTLHPNMASQVHLVKQSTQSTTICERYGLNKFHMLIRCSLGRILTFLSNKHRPGILKGIRSELPRVFHELKGPTTGASPKTKEAKL
jgi:glycosyltransferase involved in cell wall biosynthesis